MLGTDTSLRLTDLSTKSYGTSSASKIFNRVSQDTVAYLEQEISLCSDSDGKIELAHQFIDMVASKNKDTIEVNGLFLSLCEKNPAFYQDEKISKFIKNTIAPSIKSSLKETRDLSAISKLGVAYQQGNGVKQDLGRAIKLLCIAANKGEKDALCKLGIAYQQGHGVERNFDEAIRLLSLAADQGQTEAAFALAQILSEKQRALSSIESHFTDYRPDIIKYYTIAANGGYKGAAYLLAKAHELEGTKEGHAFAYSYFKIAAEKDGDPQAQKEIDTFIPARAEALYLHAENLWKSKGFYNSNETEATHLYEMAAEFGSDDAKAKLLFERAERLWESQSLDNTNKAEAIRLYEMAAKLNNRDAIDKLFMM